MELYKNFSEHLLNNLLKNNEEIKNLSKISNLIRKHKTNLLKLGDLSIPLDEKLWHYYNIKVDENFHSTIKNLVEISKNWTINIIKICLIIKNNINVCNLYINRTCFFKDFIKVFTEINYGQIVLHDTPKYVYNICVENESIELEKLTVSQYRIVLIKNILINILHYVRYEDDKECVHKNILVTVTTPADHNNYTIIKCGHVYHPQDGKKISQMTALQYIQQRSIDMQLMAQHKYGLRVRNEKIFIDLINQLGSAAVTVDLIETKHANPVGIVTGNRHSSSKGASFILYNSARLEAIFRLFDERVENGYYSSLPSYEKIDFTLLKEEEEWEMFYCYIFEFPNLIQRSVGNVNNAEIALHTICSYLNSLVGLFSVYYRRVKILTENRPQLLPVMYARLTLLQCLRLILNKVLKILSIDPVTQM